jgi:hypothetical protein
MTLSAYLFAVAFYLLAGFLLYFCFRRAIPRMMNKEWTKLILLAAISALTLGGVSFASFAFFFL